MSGLRLSLRGAPPCRLDLSPLLPSRLAGLAPGAIERLTLAAGVRVADVFAVQGGAAAEIVIEGGSSLLDHVGAGLDGGVLHLEGDAGAGAGGGMTGGTLRIRGATGPFAAAGLRGGTVELVGDTGDGLGGPLPDGSTGMAGGLVVVRGNAGEGAGERQRRGVLIVEGDAGALAGSRMIAGTLIVCGRAGARPGIMMRRGTVVLGAGSAPPPPSFAPAGQPAPVFPSLLARYVLGTSCPSVRAAELLRRNLDRFAGDLASVGKGEVLACR